MNARIPLRDSAHFRAEALRIGGERVTRIIEESRAFNVTGTPTLIVNGRKLEEPDAQTWEGLSRILEAELAS